MTKNYTLSEDNIYPWRPPLHDIKQMIKLEKKTRCKVQAKPSLILYKYNITKIYVVLIFLMGLISL